MTFVPLILLFAASFNLVYSTPIQCSNLNRPVHPHTLVTDIHLLSQVQSCDKQTLDSFQNKVDFTFLLNGSQLEDEVLRQIPLTFIESFVERQLVGMGAPSMVQLTSSKPEHVPSSLVYMNFVMRLVKLHGNECTAQEPTCHQLTQLFDLLLRMSLPLPTSLRTQPQSITRFYSRLFWQSLYYEAKEFVPCTSLQFIVSRQFGATQRFDATGVLLWFEWNSLGQLSSIAREYQNPRSVKSESFIVKTLSTLAWEPNFVSTKWNTTDLALNKNQDEQVLIESRVCWKA